MHVKGLLLLIALLLKLPQKRAKEECKNCANNYWNVALSYK